MDIYRKAADEHFKHNKTIRALAKKIQCLPCDISQVYKKIKAGNTSAIVGYRCVNRVFIVDEEKKLQDFN